MLVLNVIYGLLDCIHNISITKLKALGESQFSLLILADMLFAIGCLAVE
jgi:hypothetical protein